MQKSPAFRSGIYFSCSVCFYSCFQNTIPPACLPIFTDATFFKVTRSIISTDPGSPPIPSTDRKAYLLSSEIATPWVTFLLFGIFASSFRFFQIPNPRRSFSFIRYDQKFTIGSDIQVVRCFSTCHSMCYFP